VLHQFMLMLPSSLTGLQKILKAFTLFTILIASVAAAPSQDSGRIIGGQIAKRGDYPFLISLNYRTVAIPEQHVCGGSIINKEWILTAGHCITEIPYPGVFHVIAGMTDMKNPTGEQWQKIKVVKRIVHEEFKNGDMSKDIALLKLQKPLEFNEFVQMIELPKKDAETHGVVELAGWGSINPDPMHPEVPPQMQKADLPILEYDDCHEALDKLGDKHPLAHTNICAGPLTGGLSPCVGDSGGPLVQRTKEGVTQRGIVSWGLAPCAQPGAPSVYADVAKFIDWITKNIESN